MSIEFKNIQVSFGARTLYTCEKLVIPNNSKVGIVGDNGSGKTTLLSLICADIIPDTGTVHTTGDIAYIKQLTNTDMSMSGGKMSKAAILEALKIPSQILLADEPTTHLDTKGITYLEKQLTDYIGTVLIASHNRSFLNNTVTKILEIENGKLSLYEGNYDSYEAQKKIETIEHQKKYEKYQSETKHIKQAMCEVKNKSANTKKTPTRMGNSEARLHKMGNQSSKKNLDNKAKSLQSRLTHLDKVEKLKDKKKLTIPFSDSQKIHKKLLIDCDNFSFSYMDNKLFDNCQFKLYNGSRTAILGDNGCGKTTLFNEIISQNKSMTFVHGLKIGYFTQSFDNLDVSKTVYENIAMHVNQPPQVIRDTLAHMQFRQDDIFKKVSTLSGGEKNKLLISRLLLDNFNVLLLDEPTNHLDVTSIKALETALCSYKGTILFTSHDKSFVQNVASNTWLIENKKIRDTDYNGNKNVKDTINKDQLLLLEIKKTRLLSLLSSSSMHDKQALETELFEINTLIAKIKNVK